MAEAVTFIHTIRPGEYYALHKGKPLWLRPYEVRSVVPEPRLPWIGQRTKVEHSMILTGECLLNWGHKSWVVTPGKCEYCGKFTDQRILLVERVDEERYVTSLVCARCADEQLAEFEKIHPDLWARPIGK